MEFFRRLLRHTFTALVAVVLLFEEWGWVPLAALLARLARLPLFAWLERRIAALPPWAAMATFALPALALLPVKLMALFLIGKGHALMGVGVLVGAKLLGTALLARLFTLTQPALMKLAWFARWYPRWKAWKDGVIAQVRASRMWITVSQWKRDVRERWAAFRKRNGLAAGKD
ncbi:hypothetical protein [Ramlibacter sp. WS9]|uniref:hypothetical protein n=1 Tax=Ramlibacter sp. WS9 TaxID=1882741 RepID=UPI001E2D60E5|nr:hypothetical protein [Ramlibacter sp. WS9]